MSVKSVAASCVVAAPCATWPAWAMAVTSVAVWMLVLAAWTTSVTVDKASALTPELVAMDVTESADVRIVSPGCKSRSGRGGQWRPR